METVLDTYQQVVHSNATVTATGSSTVAMNFGHKEVSLVINVTAPPTGTTPSITYTVQEVDPGNGSTVIGAAKSGTAITGITTQIITLPVMVGGDVLVSWSVTGTAPSFTGVYATLVNKGPSPAIYDQAGNGPAAVKPANTAAAATDPALAVSLSPNSPLPSGTNTLGAVEITDGTHGPAAVKAASTAAAASDPALVVALSPNSPPTPASDVSASGNLSAVSSYVSVDTQGCSTLIVRVNGTWAGTITVNVSLDGGATFPGAAVPYIGGTFYPTGITANGVYFVSIAGYDVAHIVMTAYTSGTAVITANASVGLQYTKNLSYLTDGSNTANIAASNAAPTASDTALVVALSPNLPGGAVPVALYPSGAQDSLGNTVTVSRVTQITTKFYQQAPSAFLSITTSGGATATQGSGVNIGCAVFSTGTATTAEVTGTTFATVAYATQYEAWATQSAKFTTPTSSASYQRIGIYNSIDGFSWGYNGTTFGIWTRFNSTDTFIAQTAWNKDTLSGAVGSLFTSAGSPVALVQTYFNKYRIRYGWYGSITASFEVYSPDGIWVLVHQARFANSQTTVNLTNPDLPLTVDVSKTAADSTNLTIASGAWSAGVTAPPTGPIVTGIQTISSNGQYTIIPVLTQSSLSFTISGTWVGTISFNYSLDGVNFSPDNVLNSSLGTFVTSTTVNNSFTSNVGSYKYYQIVATAWTSGTATITYNGSGAPNLVTSQSLITDAGNHGPAAVKAASTAAVATDPALVVALSPNSNTIQGVAAAGAAVSGNPLLLGGSDGTDAQTLRVTPVANGVEALVVVNGEGQRPTYFIALQGFGTGTTNTDVFNLIGSATKTVRVTRVRFSMTVTTAVTIPVQLIKRSTANAGGTAGVATNGAYDSNDPAATATNLAYTANATTLGTVVGTAVRSDKYFAQVATPTTGAIDVLEWDFGGVAKQPTLRGTAQSLCINLGGVTIAGGSVSALFEWTEDSN